MSPDKLVITFASLFMGGFVYWFFLGKKEKVVKVEDSIDITVDGGYRPEVIEIPANKTTTLNFLRRDPSSCLEEVIIPDFKIRKSLPLNKTTTVTLQPDKQGEFVYSCGMNMYHGKIIVK